MLQRLSMRLALWMVLVTIVLQFVHAVYRLSTDVPLAKEAGLAEIEKVVTSLQPAISEALYQYNERDSHELLKTFAVYPLVQAVWLLDDEAGGVSHWARSHSSGSGVWQQRKWSLFYQGQVIGHLKMTLDYHWLIVEAKRRVWGQIWFSSLMGLISLMLLYWVVQHQVTRPIRALANVMKQINTNDLSQEDLNVLNEVKTWGEVETLKLSLHDILVKLSQNLLDKKNTMQFLQKFNENLEENVLQRTRELSSAKNKAEQASRGKTDFLANMTHELRTPLNSIMGFSSILQTQDLPAKCQLPVTRIQQSGAHLLALINDIIDFSDMDDNELKIQIFSLYDVITTAHHGFIEQASVKGIEVITRVDDSARMCGDPIRLGVVLRHLIDNALKFSEQGQVNISCDALVTGEVIITVMDTGVGIDIEDINKLNQAFVQAESGLNRRQQGVGLGLAIVERICKKWGAELSFSNVSPHGTKVTIVLPSLSTRQEL